MKIDYKSKYLKHVIKSGARFAEPEEMIEKASVFSEDSPKAGAPILFHEGKLYVDDSDNHTAIIGPTGCKKTRCAVYTTVATIIESGESAVINDPKGEIYKTTAKRARDMGADVYVLNFRKPTKSHKWNPLSQAHIFKEKGYYDEALQCVNDFATSILSDDLARSNDPYWPNSAKALLASATMLLMESVPKEYFNLHNLIPLCYESNKGGLKRMLDNMDEASPAAFGLHMTIDLNAEKTSSCIYSSLQSSLGNVVQNEGLLDMLNGNSFDIADLANKQTLIYIVYPDEKASLNFLVNLFFTQCYETLVAEAVHSDKDRLPLRVNFVIDEFSNLTKLENFENRISEARSKNIRYFLIMQAFGQLENKYKECAEVILSNCNNWICFGSRETAFLEKVSRTCGYETDVNGIEHPLISPFEMQLLTKTWEYAEAVIIKQGVRSIVTQLPDFDYLPFSSKYEHLNTFDVEPEECDKGIFITFNEWVSGISRGKFKFPYAAKSN